jgi:hypothetical protein
MPFTPGPGWSRSNSKQIHLRKAKPFSQRRTLLAQQLLFRCGEFLEFSFIHFGIRQIK